MGLALAVSFAGRLGQSRSDALISSFPRKRESSFFKNMDPRWRGGDDSYRAERPSSKTRNPWRRVKSIDGGLKSALLRRYESLAKHPDRHGRAAAQRRDPAIHGLFLSRSAKVVDARAKPAHDAGGYAKLSIRQPGAGAYFRFFSSIAVWISCGGFVRKLGFYQQNIDGARAFPVAAARGGQHHFRWRQKCLGGIRRRIPSILGFRTPRPVLEGGFR